MVWYYKSIKTYDKKEGCTAECTMLPNETFAVCATQLNKCMRENAKIWNSTHSSKLSSIWLLQKVLHLAGILLSQNFSDTPHVYRVFIRLRGHPAQSAMALAV